MTNKKLIAFVLGVMLIVVISVVLEIGLFKKSSSTSSENKKLQVITTLYPLYDFAKTVGQDKIDATLLLPPGVEAHSFEPKPNDVIRINQADVFIYTGKFMEPWAEDVINGVTNKNLLVVDSSDGIKLIPGVFHDADEPAGTVDPHIWLDFDSDQTMIDTITKAFVEKDPANKSFYEQNAREYNGQLSSLDQEYRSTLANCKTREIVYGGHYAFGYLANRYGLKYLAAQGVSPDAEPTANDLVRLVSQVKKNNIKYVFYEELVTPKISQTIASETGAQMLLLNAAHNLSKDQLDRGVSFISIMKSNLANLKVGLECQ